MSDSFFDQDFGYVPEDQAEAVLPPLIQWRRGDLQNEDERLKAGCFQLPVERYGLDDVDPVDVLHGSKTIPSYLFKGLHVAVIGWRKDWFTGRGEDMRRVTTYDPNVRAWSRTQAWVLVKQLGNAQFMLTFSRSNSMGFEDALNQFRQTVIGPASQKARRAFPVYSFWMPVGVGDVREFKEQGTYATPPKLYLTPPVKEETLKDLYIGPDLVGVCKELYPQVKVWAERKYGKDEVTGDDEAEFDDNGHNQAGPPPPPEPPANDVAPVYAGDGEIPF